ncbi:hypothetical protein EJB05_23113, partial [Eragrostis curvula]
MDTTDPHELTVSGYSGTKGLGVGKVISSVAFTAGGHSWKIRNKNVQALGSPSSGFHKPPAQ